MKPSIYRRIRRRTVTEAANSKKENKQESSFFGDAASGVPEPSISFDYITTKDYPRL